LESIAAVPFAASHPSVAADSQPPRAAAGAFHVVRRNGAVTAFDPTKISVALTKAFLAVEGDAAAASRRVHERVEDLTARVAAAVTRRLGEGGACHIEDIQDQVELALMRAGEHKVARAYIVYRDERAKLRAAQRAALPAAAAELRVRTAAGELVPLDRARLTRVVCEACEGVPDVSAEPILAEALRSVFDGIAQVDVATALVMSARPLIEREPGYSFVTARLLLDQLRREALTFLDDGAREATHAEMAALYPEYFRDFVARGIALELLDPRLADFDLDRLGVALDPERDLAFTYLGLQTLYDRYLLQWDGRRFELPQALLMRVAMGLAVDEIDREARAIEFYRVLASFDFMSSTPTLFNAGTLRPQLSSCYLTTVPDALDGIYGAIRDNALLSKYAGGLGNDWTRVRALGAHIKGTNGKSQGIVPFLKVASDTAVAVNQGGKRKGAVCAYLETWHLDVEEFLELRKNTGDERRRTHDMHTANWIPDLFMRRVAADAPWTLFSPDETPDLHDLTGRAFERAYERHEQRAARGEVKACKTVRAVELWRKMLSMLYETGHPWITFKDACNLRSPQQHVGTVHSSNLCTEITLNTSDAEIAVCNLGSVNLANHVTERGLDLARLERTVRTAMRMLDNVIDINWYSVPQARRSNLKHRPVGLGIMGFQDALYTLRLAYASDAAVELADRSMEAISYFAIQASTELAAERGRYATFDGSLWQRGVLPIDSLQLLDDERAAELELDRGRTLDWDALRERVRNVGMRNSNCLAIAPTATISNIVGVAQSIEPAYRNLYVKSNLSGEFTVINPQLVADLKARGLWDEVMVHDLKYFDGALGRIDRVPDDLKALYATAFEFDAAWLVEAAARRQKWLDQSQSLNLYVAEPSGRALDALYRLAWRRGLKTTYYLRTLGATHVERSTVADGALNAVSAGAKAAGVLPAAGTAPAVCDLSDPACEACQ
jgi:ribonucleoside-diphosphate reductase alpha chain